MANYGVEIPDPLIACTSTQVGDKLHPIIEVDEVEVWRGAGVSRDEGFYATDGRAAKHLQKVLGMLLASIPEDES